MTIVLPHFYLPLSPAESDCYHLPLYSEGQSGQVNNFPLIGFGHEVNDKFRLLKSPEELNMRGGELVRTAFENLHQLSLTWKKIERGKVQYLVADGHAFAAEKILDKAFIQEASNLLNANKLAVGVPCRGLIIACDLNAEAAVEEVESLIIQHFNNLGKKQISDLVFIMEDNQIKGFRVVTKKPSAEAAFQEAQQDEMPLGFNFRLSPIKMLNGEVYFKAMVEAPMPSVLVEGCYKLLLRVLYNEGRQPDFNGLIELQTTSTSIKKSSEAEQDIVRFFDKLAQSSVLQQWANRSQKKLDITFIFNEDFQAGDFENRFVLSKPPQ